jgi:hypothetical protein
MIDQRESLVQARDGLIRRSRLTALRAFGP